MSLGAGKKQVNVPSEATSLANPITFYKQTVGNYPSNAQVWWSMKRPPELGTDKPPKQYLEVFDPSLRYQVSTGNTPVAQGHFVTDAFRLDRSNVSGVEGLNVTTAGHTRPQAVAFYEGRVWYAGAYTANYNTKIYFSGIVLKPNDVGHCYQEADPTSEEIRDLLPSDGGVLVIPEMQKCVKLMPFGTALFAFADNGVWQIGGSVGQGFKANDYSISKLSGTPALSPFSFVSVEGTPMWWNRAAINTITPSQNGVATVQSMTDLTIKSFFDDIPEQSKQYAKATYDLLTRRVQWLYRSTATDDITQIFNYDSALIFDTRVGAFYPKWNISTNPRAVIKGLFNIQGESVTQSLENVTSNSILVASNGIQVTSMIETRAIVESKTKYIVNLLSDETDLPAPPAAVNPILTDLVLSNSIQVTSNSVNVEISY